jgi:threonine dehydratase
MYQSIMAACANLKLRFQDKNTQHGDGDAQNELLQIVRNYTGHLVCVIGGGGEGGGYWGVMKRNLSS